MFFQQLRVWVGFPLFNVCVTDREGKVLLSQRLITYTYVCFVLNYNYLQEKSSPVTPVPEPSEDEPVSPTKPFKKEKRKLEKAPKHDLPERPDMLPPTKTTKRTARKSIANAPATVPQKIAKVGRIPKLSGECHVCGCTFDI